MFRLKTVPRKYAKRARVLSKASKKSVSSRSTVRVPYGINSSPFPPQYQATLRYSENPSIALGSLGGISRYFISCNSLFDPDRTATGFQPLYFDQLISIYDHYTVISATIKVSFIDSVGALNADVPLLMTIHQDDDAASSGPTPYFDKMRPEAVTTVCQNGAPATLWAKWSAAKTFGPGTLANNSLQGNAAASPSEESFFTVTFQDTSASPGTSTVVKFLFEVTYTAVFQELKSITGS